MHYIFKNTLDEIKQIFTKETIRKSKDFDIRTFIAIGIIIAITLLLIADIFVNFVIFFPLTALSLYLLKVMYEKRAIGVEKLFCKYLIILIVIVFIPFLFISLL